jgi:ubiquitin-protein ligase E3 A
MFKFYPDPGVYWFNPDSLEAGSQFQLIGMLLGLAIYNGINIPVPLPAALWKKLLGFPLRLADLSDLDPQLGCVGLFTCCRAWLRACVRRPH